MTKKKKIKKQKTKKLWGLEKLTFNKAAQQYMDWDEKMAQDLKNDPKAAEWYSKFNEEYYGNTLSKEWKDNKHYKSTRYQIYDATNARNRDMYNKRYQMGDSEGIIMDNYNTEYTNPEDAMIESLDKSEEIERFIKKALRAGTDKKFTEKLVGVVFDTED